MNDELYTVKALDVDIRDSIAFTEEVDDMLHHGWRLARVSVKDADQVTMYFTKFVDE